MTHGHASQEGEHASHHAHDPFDRRVAMSMVVIAAVLAAVKVQGHRTHNDVLGYQIKANVAHTQESDQWNFFQSKKMREVLARLEAQLLEQEATRGLGKSTEGKSSLDFAKAAASLKKDFDEILHAKEPDEPLSTESAKKAIAKDVENRDKAVDAIVADMKKRQAKLVSQGLPDSQVDRIVRAEMASRRYNQESRYILSKANVMKAEAHKYEHKSEHAHHQANFFDLGELGVELALVLSSVAILTKRSGYWYSGLALGILGVILVGVGFLAH